MNPAVKEVLERYKIVWALNHASALLNWDLETYMPEGASGPRGFSLAEISLLRQNFFLKLAPLIEKAENEPDLSDFEKGVVRVLRRGLDYFTKVPAPLVEELERASISATVPWREARKASNPSLFAPHLAKIVQLKRDEAEKLGYEGPPYNALLDQYEEGLTVSELDTIFFSRLIPQLKEILDKVLSGGKFPLSHPLEESRYDTESMKAVNNSIVKLLQMPAKTFRMDVSTHPFTVGLARDDVRVTTRYEGTNFKASMYSTIHECGHAIYDMQYDPGLEYTPVGGGASTALHESQSRFWENIVGRSRAFVNLVHPELRRNLPILEGYDAEATYLYFNTVRPTLIRVNADELTYNFHIVLRYEIEKKLIDGELSTSDISSLWQDKMQEFLNVRPTTEADGMLQDVHWSTGYFGYFPGYALGNIVSGMLWQRWNEHGFLRETIQKGELATLKETLRKSIHQWGSIYSPKDLLKREFGDTYNPAGLLRYFERKYLLED